MYLLAACMGAAVLIGVWQYMGREDGRKADKNSVRIGVLLYRGDDTFIGTLRSGLEDKAKEYEQETGIKVKLDIMDAKGSQNTQNSQVERLISLGCDALCINSVDRSSASIIIDKAMDAGTPVVFFNREPVEEDMNRWEKLYYVGADAKESAVARTARPGAGAGADAPCVGGGPGHAGRRSAGRGFRQRTRLSYLPKAGLLRDVPGGLLPCACVCRMRSGRGK